MTVVDQIREHARAAYARARALEILQVQVQDQYPELDVMPKGTRERLKQAEEAEAELAMIAAVLQKYHLASRPQRLP